MENPQQLRESVLLHDHSHLELLFSYTQLGYLWVHLLTFVSYPLGDHLREKPCAIFPIIPSGKVHIVIRSWCGRTHFLTQHVLQPLPPQQPLLHWLFPNRTVCIQRGLTSTAHRARTCWLYGKGSPAGVEIPWGTAFVHQDGQAPFCWATSKPAGSQPVVPYKDSLSHIQDFALVFVDQHKVLTGPLPAAWASLLWLAAVASCVSTDLPSLQGDQLKTCWGCTLYHPLHGELVKQDLLQYWSLTPLNRASVKT